MPLMTAPLVELGRVARERLGVDHHRRVRLWFRQEAAAFRDAPAYGQADCGIGKDIGRQRLCDRIFQIAPRHDAPDLKLKALGP